MGRVKIERVSIKDIPLEKAQSVPVVKPARSKGLSERSWALIRVTGAASVLIAIGYASFVFGPSFAGAVIAVAEFVDKGLVAGIIGLALVITIALSAVISHED